MKYYKMTTTFDEYVWVGSVYTPSDKVEEARKNYVQRDYDIIERYNHSKRKIIKYKEYSDRVEYHTSK